MVEFEAELDILDHILSEIREKAVKELDDSIKNPTEYKRIEAALSNVIALQISNVSVKVNEGIEAYIYGEHNFRIKQLIEEISPSEILDLKNVSDANSSVLTTVRSILMLLGTRPKEITDWNGCCAIVTKSGESSLKNRVAQLDSKSLSKKKKTLKLISQMIHTIKFEQLVSFPCVAAMYGFVCGTMAEIYPVYLSKSGPPEKVSTKSWGKDAPKAFSKAEKLEPSDVSKADSVSEVTPIKKAKRPSLKRKGTMML